MRKSTIPAGGSGRLGPVSTTWSEALDEHRHRQRSQIVGAALELIGEHGLTGVTMAALARRARVSRPTLYHYFHDLEQVLLAWVSDEVGGFLDDLDARLAGLATFEERLAAFIEAHLRYFAERGRTHGAELMSAQGLSPEVRRALHERLAGVKETLERILSEARSEGEARDDLDLEVTTEAVLALLGGLRMAVAEGRLAADLATATVEELVLDGLRAPTAGRPDRTSRPRAGSGARRNLRGLAGGEDRRG